MVGAHQVPRAVILRSMALEVTVLYVLMASMMRAATLEESSTNPAMRARVMTTITIAESTLTMKHHALWTPVRSRVLLSGLRE